MNNLIVLFAMFMVLAGVLLLVKPQVILKVLRENANQLWLHITAIVVRLLLGMLLVSQAGTSKLPMIIEVIGWIAILAAVLFMLIGRNNFKRLISWAFAVAIPFAPIGGILALCFGGLLIYAFL